jgi:hypothetical protein
MKKKICILELKVKRKSVGAVGLVADLRNPLLILHTRVKLKALSTSISCPTTRLILFLHSIRVYSNLGIQKDSEIHN